MVKLHVSNITRNHWANIIEALVKDGKLSLYNDKCYDYVDDFLSGFLDYEIGRGLYNSLNNLVNNPRDVMSLLCAEPEIWHNGHREIRPTFENCGKCSFFLFDAFHNENLFVTDNFEQFSQKVWDLVDTTIRFAGDRQNWDLENALYDMLEALGLADNLIYDLD